MAKYQHLEGFKELESALKELQNLTGKSGKPVLRRAVVKSSHAIRDEARQLSPWPNTADEGNIKSATSYQDGTGKRQKGREPKNAVYAYVYDPHPLAAIFEYGTADRYQESTGRYTGVITPQHHVRTATENQFDKVVKSQAGLVGEEIKKAWNKHIKKTGG